MGGVSGGISLAASPRRYGDMFRPLCQEGRRGEGIMEGRKEKGKRNKQKSQVK